MEDPTLALGELATRFAALEAAVAPLLRRPRGETMDALGSVDKAKMDVLLAFAINNLVWIFLRTRGIDPETHDVSAELERIKTYYAKVRAAEGDAGPSRRIDVPAASRIIKHSLPTQRSLDSAAPAPATAAAALARTQALAHDVGRSTRFRHIASGGEKVIPGEDRDESMEEQEEQEGQAAAADNLLAGVEADIVAEEVAQSSKKKRKTKRKRT